MNVKIVKGQEWLLICPAPIVKVLEGLVNKMDEELRNFVEERWGIYEAALTQKDARFLNRHQHTMALIRTLANVLALALSIFIAYKVW